MKKYIIIFLMLVYGLPSTGASLQLHFCCGQLDDVSFSVEHDTDCNEQVPDNTVCCSSVALDLKINADQELLAKLVSQANALPAITNHSHAWQYKLPATQAHKANEANAPPPTALLPVYIRLCVFRI